MLLSGKQLLITGVFIFLGYIELYKQLQRNMSTVSIKQNVLTSRPLMGKQISVKQEVTPSRASTRDTINIRTSTYIESFDEGEQFATRTSVLNKLSIEHENKTTRTSILNNFIFERGNSTKTPRRDKTHGQIFTKASTRDLNNSEIPRNISIIFYAPISYILIRAVRGLNMAKCPYTNCNVSMVPAISSGFLDSDAVIIQGHNCPNYVPVHRDDQQIFIFASIEAPTYLQFVNYHAEKWRNYYNWTMTYRMDSDVPYPYGSIYEREKVEPTYKNAFENQYKNYDTIFRQKSKTVAWMVSHCETFSKREKYVDELKQYVDVDIYGSCSDLICPKGTGNLCPDRIVAKYKFYLAFENSFCLDYITEKAFSWYNMDIIIVVRGTLNYEDHLPKGTYINSDDFESPEVLARYLRELADDEDRYIEMLQRKQAYRAIEEQDRVQIAYCELCEKLNRRGHETKTITDLHNWWQNGFCLNSSVVARLTLF